MRVLRSRRVARRFGPLAIAALITLLLAAQGTATAQNQGTASNYEVIRLNGSEPIIDQQMFADLGVSSEGANINGPSLISVPDWISPSDRVSPSANYYLYFGDHGGDYIRMAWAEDLTGPWTLHDTGSSCLLYTSPSPRDRG